MAKAIVRNVSSTAQTLDRVLILVEQVKDLSNILLDMHQSDTDETLTLLNCIQDKAKEAESIVEAELLNPGSSPEAITGKDGKTRKRKQAGQR